ncbi:type I methionyl aminopeptidase [Paludisphaera rhizosphaerae]|uniref:type I methionyl aminopeptidase n=1 Tax=Paludisphaera rhizosphaerae TaxID=2711216 RepID=UPI001F10C7F3|nr:type I methionyl aminopeptidase [Paludisphaera rhizosphaerae]
MSSHRVPGRRPSLSSFLSGALKRPEGVAASKPGSPPAPGRRQPTIQLKSPREIALMREAGRLVATAHAEVAKLIKPGVTTAELDAAAAAVFRDAGATPLFLGYPCSTKGKPAFPAVICSSVNEQVVHGIPNRRPLREGDVVAVDTGCRFNGWCGDAAVTLAVGAVAPEVQKLLDVTRETLALAIRAMGRCRYWSEVASLMEQYVKSQGFSVIENFVGHGIGKEMHEEPQVPNFVSKALRKHDIRLEPGVVLAVEPMVAMGTNDVRTLEDGWTVETKDRRPSAHFEHTIAMTPDGPEILTLP